MPLSGHSLFRVIVNMNEYYTYAYLREDRTPYYIGKGKGSRVYDKRRSINKPSADKIIFLKKNITEEEAFKHEVYMIFLFGRKDIGTGILQNRTNGGEGTSGRKVTEEHKKNISLSNKGKKRTETFRKECADRARNNTNRRKKCHYRGKDFNSMTEAAKYFGVTVSAVSHYLKSN